MEKNGWIKVRRGDGWTENPTAPTSRCFDALPLADTVDPKGVDADIGVGRLLRGGSGVDSAHFCRPAMRFGRNPDYRSFYLGFRVALD